MLSLPEFIREGIPEVVRRRMDIERDPEALLTLPEFIKENPPPELVRPSSTRQTRGVSISYTNDSSRSEQPSPLPSPAAAKPAKGNRSRSMSEPLAWLLPKSGSPTQSSGRKASGKKLSRQSSTVASVPEMQGQYTCSRSCYST